MRTSDFDYQLPPELIARHPLSERTASRMMVIHRADGDIEHLQFTDLARFVRAEDLFVFNDTRVVPARFFSNDHRIELLRVESADPLHWRCLVRPGKRMKIGRTVEVGESTGTVTEIDDLGYRLLEWDQPVDEATHGQLALPPYMEREQEEADEERYQTVYAREEGAVAGPANRRLRRKRRDAACNAATVRRRGGSRTSCVDGSCRLCCNHLQIDVSS